MKKSTLLFACLSISLLSLSQKNEIAIESYKSFLFDTHLESIPFDTNYSAISQGASKAGMNYSFGLYYKRKLSNDWFLRFRPGISIRSRKDDIHQLYYDGSSYDKYEADVDLEVNNTSVNLFLGVGKEIRLTDRFSLDVGMDVGFLADISNDYNYRVESETQFYQDIWYELKTYEYSRDFANQRRIVLMPTVAPKFRLTERLSMSVELQYLSAFSISNGKGSFTIHETSQEYGIQFYSGDESYSRGTIESKSSLFSVSKLSPLFRISYQF